MTLEPQAISRRGLLAAVPILTGIPSIALASSALAHDATPEADEPVQLLFVQVAESGTATPEGNEARISLAHESGQTLYFSDRPERLAGVVDTASFLDELATLAADPPNAALVFQTEQADPTLRLVTVELTAPHASAGSIDYLVRIIDPTTTGTLTADDPSLVVDSLPPAFARATLFIDGVGTIPPSNGTSAHFHFGPGPG